MHDPDNPKISGAFKKNRKEKANTEYRRKYPEMGWVQLCSPEVVPVRNYEPGTLRRSEAVWKKIVGIHKSAQRTFERIAHHFQCWEAIRYEVNAALAGDRYRTARGSERVIDSTCVAASHRYRSGFCTIHPSVSRTTFLVFADPGDKSFGYSHVVPFHGLIDASNQPRTPV
jgi:hypothetical protein